ncbi:hypothetical protein BDP27DRAFT_1339059, partial [Rhodocollybia butyracea]
MMERFVLPAPESYNNEQHCSQSQTRGRGSRSTFSGRKTASSSLNLASSPSNYTHSSSASFIPPPAPPPTKRPRQPGHTPTKLHFHSLFAPTRNAPTPAAILYDVILPPSRNSVCSCIDTSTNASSSPLQARNPPAIPSPHTPSPSPPRTPNRFLPTSKDDREIAIYLCSNLSLYAPRPKSK